MIDQLDHDDLYSSFEEFNAAMGAGVRDPHRCSPSSGPPPRCWSAASPT